MSALKSCEVSHTIDHEKIKHAIDNYFKNTPTAKIIENLDRHAIDLAKPTLHERAKNKEREIQSDLKEEYQNGSLSLS